MKSHLLLSIVLFGWTFFYCHPTKATIEPQREVQQDLQPEKDVVPVKNAIIEMQLADWCRPCLNLKRSGAIQELEKQGWTIEYVDGIGKSYPSFRVWTNGKNRDFSGYSNKSRFFAKIKSLVKEMK